MPRLVAIKSLDSILVAIAVVVVVGVATTEAAIDEAYESETPCSVPTSYRVTFQSEWTAKRHPPDYPGNAHWSGPVYASHDSGYVMWNSTMLATEGIQNVAEDGVTGPLLDELDNDNIFNVIRGSPMFNLNKNPDQVIGNIEVDENHSLVSGIAMIAPSPDWFAGMHDIDLCTANGLWVDYAEIEGFPYDAGTDDGETYKSRNSANDPPVVMFRLTPSTVPESSNVFVFEKGNRRIVRNVMMTVLERIIGDEEICQDSEEFRFKGRSKRSCEWIAKLNQRNRKKWNKTCNREDGRGDERNVVKYFCPQACEICP